MDKGTTRSRTARADQVAIALPSAQEAPHKPTHASGPPPARFKPRQKPGPPDDPNQYKPKAIRTSVALIYKDAPFPIPPTAAMLANVRRVDLSGSGATDVRWLRGTALTWLSLAGCEVTEGWAEVGDLDMLSVLNISGTGLEALPKSLKSLGKLKAIVAMNNEWAELDGDVVSGWKELNSLSTSLNQLSKLTFSHCPRLTADSLPDLSALPLLRDVRMNNLAQLTSLPRHLASWGTGDMTLSSATKRKASGSRDRDASGSARERDLGDGLEGLDLGNCALSWDAVAGIFGLNTKPPKRGSASSPAWPHLRSLTLQSNPLALTHPTYVDLLQASPQLPNLQIIDAKRVKERKRKGEVQESREDKRTRERAGKREVKPTGANAGAGEGKMRTWGTEEANENAVDVEEDESKDAPKPRKEKRKEEGSKPAKRALDEPGDAPAPKKARHGKDKTGNVEAEGDSLPAAPKVSGKHRREKAEKVMAVDVPLSELAAPKAIDDTAQAASVDHTIVAPVPSKPSRTQTSVVGIIEVGAADGRRSKKKAKKNDKGSGGINAKAMFAKSNEEGSGLGLGGW
ncbi:RNI-like protein [Athelia psychrophila]|uniref:RNI-like protein n=1 Tax=Athelia psychrophila TaxID=1759441 RepID=A0A166W8Z9_9AGAM|nr:RNI-like protein [Fibularhizoctonia sp. CBS 109695]